MATNNHTTIKELLQGTKASAIKSARSSIIVVKSTETAYEGFKKLMENNILSAPVVDVQTNKCTGFLDMRDLVSFVVFVDDDQQSDFPSNLHDILIRGTKLLKQPSDGVTTTYLSRRNIFHPVTLNDSLWSVCEVLAKGVHRVPVVDETGHVVNIISQSTIVNFLHSHIAQIKGELSETIQHLNFGTRPVISVKKDTPAIDTFRLMDNKKISSVSVVDDEGRFVGNTSASDLKLFVKTLSLDLLRLPIMEYLNKIRQDSVSDIKMPTIACSSKDSLALVLSKLSSTKVHKLFVADDVDGFKPSCVVSITDILRKITKNK